MSKFSQKHVQYAFSSILKQQKCHKIKKKESAKKQVQKPSKFELKLSPKPSNPQVFEKTGTTPQKPSPNSRENRKVGNTAPSTVHSRGLSCSLLRALAEVSACCWLQSCKVGLF